MKSDRLIEPICKSLRDQAARIPQHEELSFYCSVCRHIGHANCSCPMGKKRPRDRGAHGCAFVAGIGRKLRHGIRRGTITLPAQPNAGAIVGRAYITVAQICNALYNQSNCTLPVMNSALLYAYGGDNTNLVPGPDVPTTVNGLTTRTIINGQAVTRGSTPYTIMTPIEVQLVATGQTIANGNVLSNNAAQYSPAYFIFSFGPQQLKFQIYLSATIVAIPGTCTVPSQTITLPGVSPTKFGGVGSIQGTQSFSISFKGCPAGFKRVGYSLVPVGSETTVPGAWPLSAGSTATGVRIRVADSSGNPATFNTSIPLRTYNKNIASGNYDVQYQASYVQTGSSITPGSVSGSMQVLVDYQ